MAFTARSGRAVIALGVDGAASSRKEIDSVADSLKRVNDSTFQKLTGQVGAIQSHLGGLKSTITDLAQLTVAGFGAGAFIGMIKGSIDAADNLNDLSKATGVTLANLAGLKLAAQQSGGDLEGIADSINKLSVAMGKDAERFAKLGITAKDPLEAFEQLADVFTAIDDPQTRAALGAAALGKSWASAAPLLSEGGDKIRMMVDRGSELSGMTQEMADRADQFNDSMAEMGTAVEGAKTKIAGDMLPALTQITTAMTNAYVEGGLLSAALIGIGGAMTHAFTDEFSSAEVKLRNLKGELDVLKNYQLNAKEAVPVLGWLLWGSEGAWDAEIASKKQDIDRLVADTASAAAAAKAKAAADRKAAEEKTAGDKAEADRVAAFLKGEAAAKAAAAAVLRQQEAYTALTNAINGRVAETAREVAGLAPLNEAEKLRIDLTERLTSGKLKLSPVEKTLYEQRVDELDANLKLIESQKIINRAWEDSAKLLNEKQEAASKSVKDAMDEASKNEDLARTFGMTASAIANLEVARLEGQRSQLVSIAVTEKEISAVETLEQLITAKKRSAAALGYVDSQESAKQANKAILDEWKTSVGQYEDLFRTGVADMLNDGKAGVTAFGKSLVTTLKTSVIDQIYKMFAQKFVVNIVGNLVGGVGAAAFSGAAAAGVGEAAAGGASGVIGAGATGALLGAGGLTGAALAGAGWVGGAATLGGSLTAGASLIGTGSIAGSIAGATMLAGAIAPIVIGGLLLNKAFGRGPKESTGTTINGTFGDQGFSGTTDEAWRKKGGWLRSDKTGVDKTTIDAATAKQFTAGYESLKAASADFASVLGINADAIKTRTQSLSIALTTDEAKNKEAISSFFVGVGDTIARELLPTLSDFAKEGEGASATLQRLATNYTAIDAALTAVGLSFESVGVSSLAMRENLVTSFGGIEALTAGFAGFGQNYLTEQERLAPVLKAVTGQMAALGYAAVDTNAEFKDLVLSLNPTDAGDAKLLASLLKIQGAFAQAHPLIDITANALQKESAIREQRANLQQQLDELTLTSAQLLGQQRAALDESNRALFDQVQAIKSQALAAQNAKTAAAGLLSGVDSAFSVLQRVAQRDMDVINKRIAKERELSDAIKSTIASMALPGNEALQRARAQAEIRSALSDAKSGRLPDAAALSKWLNVLSQDASSMFSTYEEYARDAYKTQNEIAELGALADNALSVDEKSLLAIEEMLLGVQTEIDILKGIDTNGLTLIQAVEGVRAAILAAQQNDLVNSSAAINGAYRTSLGRAPDAAGMQFFQDQVANGASVSSVVGLIQNSAEAKVQGLYQSLFGKQGDAAGVAYWTKAIGSGMSEQTARDLMMQSPEYMQLKGIPGFVDGGNHGGGARIVGEGGPELEITGPSRIVSNRDLMASLRNPVENNAALAAAYVQLTKTVARQQSALDRIAASSEELKNMFESSTAGGGAMLVEMS